LITERNGLCPLQTYHVADTVALASNQSWK